MTFNTEVLIDELQIEEVGRLEGFPTFVERVTKNIANSGKGFGRFDVQTAASESLPTGHTRTMGRPVSWNSVIQLKVGKIIWPEIECNSTFFRGGPNDGKVQSFVTPGLMVSKIRFKTESNSRLALVFGVGEQIAVSHYHSYNHALSFTSRIVF